MVRLLPALAASAVLLFALPCVVHAGDIKFAVPQNYPSSTFTYTGSASPGAVAHLWRDGQADQNADMVLANTFGGPVVLYGLGGGAFPTRRTIVSTPDRDCSAVEVGDLNGDGIPDIVCGAFSSRMRVLLGLPAGGFRAAGAYRLLGPPTELVLADFNRDGHLDIAASTYNGPVTIWLGTGDGTVRAAPRPRIPSNMSLALLADDFNEDGIPDLVVAQPFRTNAIPKSLSVGQVQILLGNGDGTFRTSGLYQVGFSAEAMQYGDVNGDGKGDLVVLNTFANDISFLYGLGGGRFAAGEPMRVGSLQGAEGLVMADLNGDGNLDLAVTQIKPATMVLFQGDGQGHFTPAGSYDVASFPEDLVAGDLNGDGCTDLAVPGNLPVLRRPDPGAARVTVLLNVSDGCQKAPD